MITTITTTTTTTVTTVSAASLALIAVCTVLMLLINKESIMVSTKQNDVLLSKALNIAIVPLGIVFAVTAVIQVVGVLR